MTAEGFGKSIAVGKTALRSYVLDPGHAGTQEKTSLFKAHFYGVLMRRDPCFLLEKLLKVAAGHSDRSTYFIV